MERVLSGDLVAEFVSQLENRKEVGAAWFHGSRIKGSSRPGSDLDVAIWTAGAPVDPLSWRDLSISWESTLGFPIHLGRVGTDLPVFAHQVISHGKLFYSRDPFETDLFIATALGVYARFQEDRKEVLLAYRLIK